MPLPKDGDLNGKRFVHWLEGVFPQTADLPILFFVNWQFPLTAPPGACTGGEIDGSHLFIPDSCNNHLI